MLCFPEAGRAVPTSFQKVIIGGTVTLGGDIVTGVIVYGGYTTPLCGPVKDPIAGCTMGRVCVIVGQTLGGAVG